MKKSNDVLKLSGFTTDDGEFITYINNVQVDYCLLLRRIDPRYGDLLENFEIIKPIFSVQTIGNTYTKDISTNEKYPYCRIVKEKNKRYIYNKKLPLTSDVVVVSYREYFFNNFYNKLEDKTIGMKEIYRLWNQHLLEHMLETLNNENEIKQARTRK